MTSAQGLLAANRSLFQLLHKFYSSDSRFKLMTFATLVAFTTDFELTPTLCSVPSLFHVCEAINWMSGNAYTVVLSYDKFVQICRTLAVYLFCETTMSSLRRSSTSRTATTPRANSSGS